MTEQPTEIEQRIAAVFRIDNPHPGIGPLTGVDPRVGPAVDAAFDAFDPTKFDPTNQEKL